MTSVVIADDQELVRSGLVIAKLGGPSRAQLVVLAYETGLVRPGDVAGSPAS
jgi:hypothetical protein